MMLRTIFPDLFLADMLPALSTLIHNRYGRYPEQFSKVYRVMKSTREIEQTSQLSGVTLFSQIPEGSPMRYDEPVPGFNKTYTHAQYGLGFRASRVLVDDDRYSLIKKMATDLGRSAKESVELLAASTFNNAFSGSYLGPDGKALCATDHPLVKSGGTQTNAAAAAADLSVTSLQLALTAFRKQVDSSGRKIRLAPSTLVVPPDLEFTAAEILGGPMRSDTTNNTINAFRQRDGFGAFRNVMVYEYLTSTTNWFVMADPGETEIRFYWREKPEPIHDVDFDTRSIKTAMWMRFSYGWSDFYGIYGVGS